MARGQEATYETDIFERLNDKSGHICWIKELLKVAFLCKIRPLEGQGWPERRWLKGTQPEGREGRTPERLRDSNPPGLLRYGDTELSIDCLGVDRRVLNKKPRI
jgi:hypothetical protein